MKDVVEPLRPIKSPEESITQFDLIIKSKDKNGIDLPVCGSFIQWGMMKPEDCPV